MPHADMMKPLSERDILTRCALRFDGWQYRDDTKFDLPRALDTFWRTGTWSLLPEEKLAAFFLLQRGLCKYDLEREPENGKYWRAYRTLFFEVCELDIPQQYRHEGGIAVWEEEYRPRLTECIEAVRRVHETIQYDDEARPHP